VDAVLRLLQLGDLLQVLLLGTDLRFYTGVLVDFACHVASSGTAPGTGLAQQSIEAPGLHPEFLHTRQGAQQQLCWRRWWRWRRRSRAQQHWHWR